MRIISILGTLLITSQVLATTMKLNQRKPTLTSASLRSLKIIDQKFQFWTGAFGLIEANVCNRASEIFSLYELGNLDALLLANQKDLVVEVEITFAGMDPSKDACVSSAKILAN